MAAVEIRSCKEIRGLESLKRIASWKLEVL